MGLHLTGSSVTQLSNAFVGLPGSGIGDYAVASRLSSGTNGFAWVTKEEAVARALGWVVVTDARWAGGAKGDGVTDSTAALIAAYANGGVVWHPPGTYLNSGNVTLLSDTTLRGAGAGTSILRLANGSNADMIVSSGFGTLVAGGTAGGVIRVRMEGLEVDGNAAGQTVRATTVTSGSNGLSLPQVTINVASTANWPTPSGATTVAAGSNGVNVSTFAGSGTLNVASTSALPSSGVVTVVAGSGTAVVSYTGKTSTTLTGCTTWTATTGFGTVSTGAAVTAAQVAHVTGVVGEQVIAYTGKTSTTLTGAAGGSGSSALNTGNVVYVGGRGVAIYGQYIRMDDVWIHDCAGSGLHTEWGPFNSTSTGSMESRFTGMKFSLNGASGWQFSGPHDSYGHECIAWDNAWAGFAMRNTLYLGKCHAWGAPQLYGYDIAGGDCRLVDCYAEVAVAAGYGARILGANAKWINGWINGVSGGLGMLITGTASDYVVTGIFTACNGSAIRYGSTDGGKGVIDIISQQQYGPIIASHFGYAGLPVPSTVTFVDGTVVRSDASAAGSAATNVITDTAIVQADRGKAVFGTNIPANARVGSVTTGTSFTLLDYFGAALNPTGTVSGVTLVPAGSDLSDVAASTRIRAIAQPPSGFSATAVLSVDTGAQGLRKSANLSPSATVDTYGTAMIITPPTQGAGVNLTHIAFGPNSIGSETITFRATAVYHDGTVATVTKTVTTTGTVAFANSDLYTLIGNGKTIMQLAFDVKSSIPSSTSTIGTFAAA